MRCASPDVVAVLVWGSAPIIITSLDFRTYNLNPKPSTLFLQSLFASYGKGGHETIPKAKKGRVGMLAFTSG